MIFQGCLLGCLNAVKLTLPLFPRQARGKHWRSFWASHIRRLQRSSPPATPRTAGRSSSCRQAARRMGRGAARAPWPPPLSRQARNGHLWSFQPRRSSPQRPRPCSRPAAPAPCNQPSLRRRRGHWARRLRPRPACCLSRAARRCRRASPPLGRHRSMPMPCRRRRRSTSAGCRQRRISPAATCCRPPTTRAACRRRTAATRAGTRPAAAHGPSALWM